MRKNGGITLIALVITIIILLILAGISISMLTGENGILTKTQQAKENYQRETAREKVQIAVLSYQVNTENTTLYEELRKIEGLTSIMPDNEQDDSIYTVIVDGYEFTVDEELRVSEGKKADRRITPKIKEIKYEIEKTEAPLEVTITAITEDEEGLKQIKVSYINREGESIIYKDVPIENEGNITGKEARIMVQIPANGEYVIQVIGQNDTITKQEITIDNLVNDTILATITQGTVIDNHVELTITGTTTELPIKEMELYIDEKKIEAIEYTTNEEMHKVATYIIKDMEFYKEYPCYVKVTNTRGKEGISDTKRPQNITTIKTQTDLENLATRVNSGKTLSGKTLQIVENINLQNNSWTPIGKQGYEFTGTIDGNGHTISNLYINNTTLKDQGLFGSTKNATIKNLTIGSGSINAKDNCGAIVGYSYNGTIENCTNNATITGSASVGGIVGWNNDSTCIENCINNGSIKGSDMVGGITGRCQWLGSIKKCGNIGTVTGNQRTGGITGYIDNGIIESCYNKGAVTVSVTNGGGIVGYSTETNIRYNYNTANVTCSYMGGGISGFVFKGVVIGCYNKGIITGTGIGPAGNSNIAGILGVAKDSVTIEYCYNLGNVKNNTTGLGVGGIVGSLVSNDIVNPNKSYASKVQYCYNAETVTSKGSRVGGISGRICNYCSVKNSYVTSNLIVQGNGATATANRGVEPDFIGKIAGELEIVSSEHLSNNTNNITVSVYYVVNGHSSGSSSYWSNSNISQPKLIWEK